MTFEDLQIDIFRKDTSVNVSPRGVRIIHKPTGITVSYKDEGTQTENKMLALIELAEKLVRKQTIDDVLKTIDGYLGNHPEYDEIQMREEIKALSEGKE